MTVISKKHVVRITDACGPACATASQGRSALARIQPLVREGQPLEIDFTGVDVLTTLFLNNAIGQLFKFVSDDGEADALESLLHFSGLDDDDLNRVRNVIARARILHLRPEEYRRAMLNSFDMDQ